LGLLAYVVIYTVVLQKGYQTYDNLVGSSMIKVKGSAHIGDLDNATIYDQYDLVVPPLMPDAVFMTTNFIETVNQSRTICDGNLDGDLNDPYNPVKSELCNCSYSNNVTLCCQYGEHTENGMKLGYCGTDKIHCALKAWCPLEQPPANPNITILENVQNWTVFIRANIRFPVFNVSRSNTQANVTLGKDLFYVSDILKATGWTYDEIKSGGAIVLATFEFNCDLNQDENNCNPNINFLRLDSTQPNSASTGFNYRYSTPNRDLSTGFLTRDLHKVYGMNLIVQMYGTAGRFSMVALTITLGSGLAILSLSTLFCDIIMQFIIPGHPKYAQEKYHVVRDSQSPSLLEDTVSS